MTERIPDINLLPEIREEKPILTYLFVTMLILIFFSFILMFYLYFSFSSKLDEVTKELATLSDQRDELLNQLYALQEDGTSNYNQAIAFAEKHKLPTSLLISELNELLPDDAYLSEYVYNHEEVKVTTHFETLDQIANYITDITNLNYISDLRLDKVESFVLSEEVSQEQKVDFTTIPRYESIFSLDIIKEELKEERADNE